MVSDQERQGMEKRYAQLNRELWSTKDPTRQEQIRQEMQKIDNTLRPAKFQTANPEKTGSETKFPVLLLLMLIGGAVLAYLIQLFLKPTLLEFPIFLIYLFIALLLGITAIFNWFSEKDPQNKNIWTAVKWISVISVVLIYSFLIYTQTAYAEEIIKIGKKGVRGISNFFANFQDTISFYTCTLSNPINPEECAKEEENVEKDIALYNTLELTYGIKTASRVIPPATPEGGKPYTLDFTLSNTNEPSKEFDYNIDVIGIEVEAADKISKTASIIDTTTTDVPQTLVPLESYPFEADFSLLPECLTYSEDLKGRLYFYVDVTTEQTTGASTPFMLVPNRVDFQDEVEYFYNNLKIKPGPGSIDVYAFIKPFVIETDEKDTIDIEIKIDNTKTEGIATIESLALIHTVEKGEANPFDINCESNDITISGITEVSCPEGKNGNCINITFNQLQVREGRVYSLTCPATLNKPLSLTSEKTDDIAISARYQYKQTFGPDSAIATCTLQTTGTTVPGDGGAVGYCSGTAVPCSNLNRPDCIKQDGCQATTTAGCVGIATPCNEITKDETSCKAQQGCSWTSGGDVIQKIASMAKSQGVPADLAIAIAEVESSLQHYDANGNVKRGGSGEVGLFQVIPGGGGCSEQDLMDIDKNIECGIRHLVGKCNGVPYGYCQSNPSICQCSGSGNCLQSSATCVYCPVSGPKTYRGWDIATRGYNGWGKCDTPGNYNYVETVNSKRSKYSGYN